MSKNNKVYTIYQIKNLINGMIYIGCHYTNNIHDRYLGSGKCLKKAFKEYGRKNFKKTIICITKDWEVARKLERLYVDEEFIKRKDTYNSELGGLYHSDSRKIEISKSLLGHIPWNKGKHISEEQKRKHSEYMKQNNPMKGKHHSEETKRKISEANKNISEETRKKLSEACKGRIISEEQRRKISKTLLGNIPWNKGKTKYSMCENMTLEEFNIYCKENNISQRIKDYIKYKFNINK